MTENTGTPNPTTPGAELTDEEHQLVRRAAFGAIALVSKADPGFFSMFKESMAGSKAFAAAPAGVQELLREGGFPTPPTGSPEQIESQIISDLGQAMQVLQTKSPAQADGFRQVVLDAADRVANASDGVAPEEQAMIERLRNALGGGAGLSGQTDLAGQSGSPADAAGLSAQVPQGAPTEEPQGMPQLPTDERR